MGLLDDFSELFAGINELGDEIRGIKEDFMSTVIEPGQEFQDTVSDIAGSVTGAAPSIPVIDDASPIIDDATAS